MYRLLFFSFVCLSVACASTKNNFRGPGALNGIWIPVKQEMDGKALPLPGFERDTLTIFDTTYNYTSRDKGVVNYFSDGRMDIYGREGVNAGRHFTAIFKLDRSVLTICYNLDGDSYPADFETISKRSLFLSIFKRSTE